MDVFDFPASLAERQSSPAASASPAASSSSAESASFGYGGAGAATTGSVFPRTFSNQRKQRRASSHRAPELTNGPLQWGSCSNRFVERACTLLTGPHLL